MADLLVLSRADVERLLDIGALLGALEQAFVAASAGATSVPPRTASFSPDGLLGVMPAWMPGTLETKLVSVFPGNHERGLPSHQALIALFDESDGRPLALLDGTHITALRTAAAAAVATRALARPDSRVLAILGAGVQGRSHQEVYGAHLDFAEVRVATRSRGDSFEEAVRGADVVCCCTDAEDPILDAAWIEPGTHVSSVGGSPRGRGELPVPLVRSARLFVETRVTFQAPPAGAPELKGLDPATASELGEVLSGRRPGRRSPEEITVYKSVGHAVEDACAARLVYDRALAEGVGSTVTI